MATPDSIDAVLAEARWTLLVCEEEINEIRSSVAQHKETVAKRAADEHQRAATFADQEELPDKWVASLRPQTQRDVLRIELLLIDMKIEEETLLMDMAETETLSQRVKIDKLHLRREQRIHDALSIAILQYHGAVSTDAGPTTVAARVAELKDIVNVYNETLDAYASQ